MRKFANKVQKPASHPRMPGEQHSAAQDHDAKYHAVNSKRHAKNAQRIPASRLH